VEDGAVRRVEEAPSESDEGGESEGRWGRFKRYLKQFKRYCVQWWRREPHLIVGSVQNPYLLRWWIIPRNPLFNVYLHKFLRPDDDRALHDHPWCSLSMLLRGSYMEVTEYTAVTDAGESVPALQWKTYERGAVIARWPTHKHRIDLFLESAAKLTFKPAWTLFITGPTWREWGFHCPKGWVHWRRFITGDGTEVTESKGCPE
jgi:hypothetical protein